MRVLRKIVVVFKTLLRLIALVGFILVVYLIIDIWGKVNAELSIYRNEARELVQASDVNTFRSEETSYVYDANGDLLVRLKGDKDTIYVKYDDIPEAVINAFVAVEDRNFWTHSGIDLKGIARILYRFAITSGNEQHGASTITQQLARNIFLSHEVSMDRKLNEIFISFELENKYSKEEIMEYYVNNIYYGHQCYGIGSAAYYYFGKGIDKCSLAEIAFLCSIPNNPTLYDPVKNYDNTVDRQAKILGDMQECGFISEDTEATALAEKVELDIQTSSFYNYETTYAIECAVRYLMQYVYSFRPNYTFDTYEEYERYMERYNEIYSKAKKELKTGGYIIKTSLDRDKQEQLQESIDEVLDFSTEIDETTNAYALQGAATCIDNNTGKVVAIVGGRTQDTDVYTLNRAYQSTRQPGSSIKPILVYTPSFEAGYDADTIVEDTPIEDGPKNSGDSYSGKIPLRTAIAKSKNVVAWKLYEELTPELGVKYLQKMQFKKIVPDDYYLSACLGGLTYGATTEEMSGAYAAIANNGVFRETTCITSIVNAESKEIYKEAESEEIYSPLATQRMIDCLITVVESGTASKLAWNEDVQAAGKTGTTNENTNGWFCGMTPYYTLSVWVGFDDARSMTGLQGSSYPLQIWGSAMRKFIVDEEACTFSFEEIENETEIQKHLNNSKDHDTSWLEGKDDSETLVNSYTVADYKKDHSLGELLDGLLSDMKTSDSVDELDRVYATFEAKLEYFVSNKMKNDYSTLADTAYTKAVSRIKAAIEKAEKEEEDRIKKEQEEKEKEEEEDYTVIIEDDNSDEDEKLDDGTEPEDTMVPAPEPELTSEPEATMVPTPEPMPEPEPTSEVPPEPEPTSEAPPEPLATQGPEEQLESLEPLEQHTETTQ